MTRKLHEFTNTKQAYDTYMYEILAEFEVPAIRKKDLSHNTNQEKATSQTKSDNNDYNLEQGDSFMYLCATPEEDNN